MRCANKYEKNNWKAHDESIQHDSDSKMEDLGEMKLGCVELKSCASKDWNGLEVPSGVRRLESAESENGLLNQPKDENCLKSMEYGFGSKLISSKVSRERL